MRVKGKKQFFVTGYRDEVFVVNAASEDAAMDIVARKLIEVDPEPEKTFFEAHDLTAVLSRAFNIDSVTFL